MQATGGRADCLSIGWDHSLLTVEKKPHLIHSFNMAD